MRITRQHMFAHGPSVGLRPPVRAFSNQRILDRIRLNLLTALRNQTLKHEIYTLLTQHFCKIDLGQPFILEMFLTVTLLKVDNERPPISVRFKFFPTSAFPESDCTPLGFFLERSIRPTVRRLTFNQRDKFSKTFAAAQKDILAAMLSNDWVLRDLQKTRQAIAPIPIDQFLLYSQMLWRSDLGTVAPNPPSIDVRHGDNHPQSQE